MKIMLLASLIISSTAFGYGYTCKKGTDERFVSVAFNNDTHTKVPCTTLYIKGKDEKPSGEWRYSRDPRECEKRADEMAEKIKSWGFTCELAK